MILKFNNEITEIHEKNFLTTFVLCTFSLFLIRVRKKNYKT